MAACALSLPHRTDRRERGPLFSFLLSSFFFEALFFSRKMLSCAPESSVKAPDVGEHAFAIFLAVSPFSPERSLPSVFASCLESLQESSFVSFLFPTEQSFSFTRSSFRDQEVACSPLLFLFCLSGNDGPQGAGNCTSSRRLSFLFLPAVIAQKIMNLSAPEIARVRAVFLSSCLS